MKIRDTNFESSSGGSQMPKQVNVFILVILLESPRCAGTFLDPHTVIRNGNFSALTLFDDIMLRNTYAAYSRTS